MFALKLAVAGLGHMVAHWSIGLIVIALCLVGEFGTGWVISYLPILEKPLKWLQKYLLFVAVGTALVLFGEWLGARDMAGRCEAKAAVVVDQVHKAVTKSKTRPGAKGKWTTDQ